MTPATATNDVAAKSVTEMETALGAGDEQVQAALRRFEEAEAKYGQLTNRDRFQTDEAWQASFREHAGVLDGPEGELLAAADGAYNLTRQVQALTDAGAREQIKLPDDEMARAASLREFVKEDCALGLPYSDLRDALREALGEGNRAALWLYLRYAPARLGEPLKPGEETDQRAARQAIEQMLDRAAVLLSDGKTQALREKAQVLRARALEASQRASVRQNAALTEQMRERYAARY